MEILENKGAWEEGFSRGWLANLHETGNIDWSLYTHPRNEQSPEGPGINLSDCRLILVSSAGAYLKHSQEPFDVEDPLGDYSIREIPTATSPDSLAYAHGHYDPTFIEADMQVGLPFGHLRSLISNGTLGELVEPALSIMGYQPNSARSVDQMVPALLSKARESGATAALFAPL